MPGTSTIIREIFRLNSVHVKNFSCIKFLVVYEHLTRTQILRVLTIFLVSLILVVLGFLTA